MSGPVTRGGVISLRLPVAVDHKIRQRAAAKGMSVGKYMAFLASRDVSDTTNVA